MATPPSDDIHVRLPRKLKRSAQKVIEANGMDISAAVRLFFMHIVLQGTIPLPWIKVGGLSPKYKEDLLRQMGKMAKFS